MAGWGVGWGLFPLSTVALNATPDMFLSTVAALLVCCRYIGGAVGFSIYYAVFSGKLKTKLPTMIAQAVAQAGLPLTSIEEFITTFLTEPTAIAQFEGVTPTIIQAAGRASQQAYSDCLKYVWYTSIPFGGLCIIGALVMKSNKKFITNRVAAVSFCKSAKLQINNMFPDSRVVSEFGGYKAMYAAVGDICISWTAAVGVR